MKIFDPSILCIFSMAAACTALNAQDGAASLEIEGKVLKLQSNSKCSEAQPSWRPSAKYLAQHDPRQEQGLAIYGEDRQFAQTDIDEIRELLVLGGFYYPNGSESVITWMDFDGDGHCDFTASAGIGGMRSIDRMFLFRGLPDGQFQLIHSHISYMDTTIALIPYIPLKVSGEKLPLLITPKENEMLQWQSSSQRLESCNVHSTGNPDRPATTLELLCPHVHYIANCANNQLPNANEAFNWRSEPE